MKYKCSKCGLSFSDKVYPIHIARCTVGDEVEENVEAIEEETADKVEENVEVDIDELSFNELRSLAKDKGIKVGKNPDKSELLEALRGE